MAVLPDKDIAGVALNAGFSGGALTTAVAIALAESSGNPRAHNTNAATGDNSYGLWQINMIGAMGPARRKQFGIASNDDLFDPSTNARAAMMLYKARGGFGDWSTYNRGTYLRFVSRAAQAVRDNGGRAVVTGKGGGTDPNNPLIPDPIEGPLNSLNQSLAAVQGFVAFVTNKDNWIRVAMFAGGTVLVIVGVMMYIGQTKSVQQGVKAVVNVIPVGRAGKAAKGAVG